MQIFMYNGFLKHITTVQMYALHFRYKKDIFPFVWITPPTVFMIGINVLHVLVSNMYN